MIEKRVQYKQTQECECNRATMCMLTFPPKWLASLISIFQWLIYLPSLVRNVMSLYILHWQWFDLIIDCHRSIVYCLRLSKCLEDC